MWQKKLIISGVSEIVLKNDYEDYEEIVIEKGVKKIDEAAFMNCVNLRCITLPNTIEEIGSCAFMGCENLEYINIPKKCKVIGDFAFIDCSSKIKFIGNEKQLDKIEIGVNNDALTCSPIFCKGVYRLRYEHNNQVKTLFLEDLKSVKTELNYTSRSSIERISLKTIGNPKSGDSKELFFNLINCVEIDVSELDTSKMTNMDKMFSNCKSLSLLDLSGFKTKNVTSNKDMLLNCDCDVLLAKNSFLAQIYGFVN